MASFRKFLFYYTPALLWAGVVFYFSSIPDLKVGMQLAFWEVMLRKIAHIGEYMVLSFLLWRIFFYGYGLSFFESFWRTNFLILLYAFSDEIHQHFVPGRAGKLVDVAVDFFGALFVLGMLGFLKSQKNATKYFLVGLGGAVFVVFLVFYLSEDAQRLQDNQVLPTKPLVPMERNVSNKEDPQVAEEILKEEPLNEKKTEEFTADNQELPEKILQEVPFTSQAPYALWDDIHEEACEEASIIMVNYFLEKKSLNKEIAEEEIQKLKDFQLEKYGTYKDSNMKRLVEIAEKFYGLENLEVVYDFKKEDIKKYLARGDILILPTAGRKLGNPNFTPPGPLYHNLVAIGYEGDVIITNDPGTRKGEKFRYNLDVLYSAIHDFPGDKDQIEKGRKAMIVASH
jgi:VanZ family protein